MIKYEAISVGLNGEFLIQKSEGGLRWYFYRDGVPHRFGNLGAAEWFIERLYLQHDRWLVANEGWMDVHTRYQGGALAPSIKHRDSLANSVFRKLA